MPFPQPFQKLGSQTNPGVTPQCPPAQLRYSVPLHTTFPLPSPLAETILNTQRRVFWAQEPQGAFISGDVGKQAGGVGVGTGVCSTRILTHSYAGDTRAASSLARSNYAVPRAHMNPTSAENTKTVHVGEQPPWHPLGLMAECGLHVHANSQDQCLWVSLSARQLRRGTTQQVGLLRHQAQIRSPGSYCC